MKKNSKKRKLGPLTFYTGSSDLSNIVYVISGIGKTNAAHAASLLAHNYAPSAVVNFGVGGAYPGSGLEIGDLAVAVKEIYADEGVLLKSGFRSLRLIGTPLVQTPEGELFNEFPLDKALSRSLLHCSKPVARARSGTFTTVSLCTGTDERSKELAGRFHAICENMEGAAVAHICRLYGIPFGEIRGISNIVEDRAKKKWDLKKAAGNCQRAIANFLGAMDGEN